MGGFVKLQLKDTSQEHIDDQNDVLSELGVEDPYHFYSEKDVQLEYEYFVKNEGEFPERLFPRNEILSYEDFKQYWSTKALGEAFVPPYGALTFDCYFGRTDENVMKGIGKYLLENLALLEMCDSGSYETFVERAGLNTEEQKKILELYEEFEPEMLPKKERTKKDLQSGRWLCKSWSDTPFWVLYGNVTSPQFMQDRQFVNNLYNNLYKDDRGYCYMLMPLMPFGSDSEWFENVYNKAADMGLRESPYFILSLLYNVETNNESKVVEQFKKIYTKEELEYRFESVFRDTAYTYQYNHPGGFVYRQVNKRGKLGGFVPVGGNTSVLSSACQLMNMLYEALGADELHIWKLVEKHTSYEYHKS